MRPEATRWCSRGVDGRRAQKRMAADPLKDGPKSGIFSSRCVSFPDS